MINSDIIKDKFTGESRGFGFVEMPNKDKGEKAIAALNGKDMKGRNLTVNEARPRTDRPRTGAAAVSAAAPAAAAAATKSPV